MRQYAKVVWTAADVAGLRPGWSFTECEEFLRKNSRHIQDRLIELGWEVIEALLPEDTTPRDCSTCCHNNKGACDYDGDCDGITHPKWNRNCGDKRAH